MFCCGFVVVWLTDDEGLNQDRGDNYNDRQWQLQDLVINRWLIMKVEGKG